MTENHMTKVAVRRIMNHRDVTYTQAMRMNNGKICYWCEGELKMDRHGMYTEEVGEFWSEKLQNSILGHPDCTPRGIDDIAEGNDPEWKLA